MDIYFKKALSLSIATMCLSATAYAGYFDKWSDLKGWVLVEVGYAESFECPYQYDFDKPNACDTWPINLKTFGTTQFVNEDKFCFKSLSFGSGLGGEEILVFMKNDTIRLAKIEGFSKKLEHEEVTIYDCPQRY